MSEQTYLMGGIPFRGEARTVGDFAEDWNGSPYVEISTKTALTLVVKLGQSLIDSGEIDPGTIQTIADISFQLADAMRHGEHYLTIGDGLTLETVAGH